MATSSRTACSNFSPVSNFIVYGKQTKDSDPFLHYKTKEVIDDGVAKQITLGQFDDKDRADRFMANVKANTKKGHWKMWVEKK